MSKSLFGLNSVLTKYVECSNVYYDNPFRDNIHAVGSSKLLSCFKIVKVCFVR